MTKGRRRSGLSTSRTTQQTSSCKPTGDSASISDLPISAIKQLNNGISAGSDSLHAKAFKADVETIVELLHPLVSKIWEEEEIPL
ncbi:hypothetical protein DPMN_031182 [Dreissena polymorpha]|uniref:Uncharacterized protein n=1 Tax=Dreissena polymorpha TaxID=45954 RepID=A0A9D4M444_DREPO|nr:hypothetical protein DPMN_031182 [Dreissena polymorpha]